MKVQKTNVDGDDFSLENILSDMMSKDDRKVHSFFDGEDDLPVKKKIKKDWFVYININIFGDIYLWIYKLIYFITMKNSNINIILIKKKQQLQLRDKSISL